MRGPTLSGSPHGCWQCVPMAGTGAVSSLVAVAVEVAVMDVPKRPIVTVRRS